MIDGIIDTNIVIDLLHEFPPAIDWFTRQRKRGIAITPIVWGEVMEGTRNKIEMQRTIRFLYQFPIEHPNYDDNNWAMRQFSRFYLSHGVEFSDLMIASIAVRLNVPLYTRNVKHFAPLPDVAEMQPY